MYEFSCLFNTAKLAQNYMGLADETSLFIENQRKTRGISEGCKVLVVSQGFQRALESREATRKGCRKAPRSILNYLGLSSLCFGRFSLGFQWPDCAGFV